MDKRETNLIEQTRHAHRWRLDDPTGERVHKKLRRPRPNTALITEAAERAYRKRMAAVKESDTVKFSDVG